MPTPINRQEPILDEEANARARDWDARLSGARLADDYRCLDCGARGFRLRCPTCQSEINQAGR